MKKDYLVSQDNQRVFEGNKKECKEYIKINGGILYKRYNGKVIRWLR